MYFWCSSVLIFIWQKKLSKKTIAPFNIRCVICSLQVHEYLLKPFCTCRLACNTMIMYRYYIHKIL
jgi:lipopolysaccharide biosynthesis glycosyltransferase